MTRGTILALSPAQAVQRALSQIIAVPALPSTAPADARPVPIAYRLKDFNGGFDPTAEHCASWSYGDRTPTADCVGFVLWASGIDRKQPGYRGSQGEWLSCVSILDDAKGARKFCELIGPDETAAARPGDWLVNEAHIGMIIRPATPVSTILVVDCSPRHSFDPVRNAAIGIGRAWADNCVVVRPKFYAP